MSQLYIENQQCWILNYEPSFKNLIFPSHFYNKIQYFIKDKIIPMNLMIIGNSGFGKMTLLKCILKECYNISIKQFKPHYQYSNILTYESIFLIDFIYFKDNEFKNISQFIKTTSTKKFIQFGETYIPKIIIFKNTHLLSNNNILFLASIIKYGIDNCLFISLSNKYIQELCSYFSIVKIPFLNNKEFKSSISKILKKHNVNLKNTNITYSKMYKTYKDTLYNFKDTLLWIQYNTLLSKNTKTTMPIKKKMIACLLNYVLSDTENLTSKKEIIHLEHIDNYLVSLIGCGISPKEILKYSTNMLLNMKIIDYEKKVKIIDMISQADKERLIVDKSFFPLKKVFVKLAILFK